MKEVMYSFADVYGDFLQVPDVAGEQVAKSLHCPSEKSHGSFLSFSRENGNWIPRNFFFSRVNKPQFP